MKKSKPIWLMAVILLLFAAFLLSCEEKCTCPVTVEQVGDYHLLYNHIWGNGSEEYPGWALEFSTKTGEIVDTIKTPFVITNMIYSTDGTIAAYRIMDRVSYRTILTINNITGDTLASTSENFGGDLFLSPDEQMLLAANYGNFTILSFPNLDSIYVEEIETISGGFMTDGERAFYYVPSVDSLFFIDYSDTENIIKTSVPIKSHSLPAYPFSAVVDYLNERLYLLSGYGEGSSVLRVYNSNDFTQLNELHIAKLFKLRPVIRPRTDEVYFGSYASVNPWNGYVDVYNFETNIMTSFLKGENLTVTSVFNPIQLEFTRDGNMLYILNGAHIGPNMVLGVNPQNGAIVQQFGPAIEYGIGSLIRISPIDHSE